MKLKTGIERKDCCGCAVCAEVCPKSALAMAPDADGFEYPELDASACVDCGMCASVCPVAGENPRGLLSEIISTHAFVHNDEKVFSESSSGGAFTAIAPACEYVVPLKGAREPSGAPRAEFLKFAREEGMLPALKKFVKMPSLPERALSFAIARAPMPAPVRDALKKFRAMLQK